MDVLQGVKRLDPTHPRIHYILWDVMKTYEMMGLYSNRVTWFLIRRESRWPPPPPLVFLVFRCFPRPTIICQCFAVERPAAVPGCYLLPCGTAGACLLLWLKRHSQQTAFSAWRWHHPCQPSLKAFGQLLGLCSLPERRGQEFVSAQQFEGCRVGKGVNTAITPENDI